MCFATLSYLFQHIWTNLLTQCTQCQFLSAMSVNCKFIPIFTVPKKFHKKYIKNQRSRRLPTPEGEPEGGHPPLGGQVAWPHPRPRQEAAWVEGATPGAPFGLYLDPVS